MENNRGKDRGLVRTLQQLAREIAIARQKLRHARAMAAIDQILVGPFIRLQRRRIHRLTIQEVVRLRAHA